MATTRCTLNLSGNGTVTYEDRTHRPVTEDVCDDDLHWDAIQWLRRWVEADQQEEGRAEGLQLLGRHLYELVFRGVIKDNFEDTFKDFDSFGGPDDTLRLELIFHLAATELSGLPWEFLYLKRDGELKGRFLAGEHNHQLVLSRFVPKGETQGRSQQSPTRPVVLMAISQPPERQFSVDALRRSLQGLHDNGKLRLIPLDNPTADELHEAMNPPGHPELRPDIFYFVGHGTGDYLEVRQSPEEARAHARATGKNPLSGAPESFGQLKASGLQNLFLEHQPKLVFLQACKGDAAGRETLRSLAKDVVYANVPAVIAMQYDIDSGPANVFAQTVFYALMKGRTIGEAVTAGRKKVAGPTRGESWDRRDFGTPVVYVHDDIALVKTSAWDARKPERKPTDMLKRHCPVCDGPVGGLACGYCAFFVLCPACKKPLDQPGKQRICGHCYEPIPTLLTSQDEVKLQPRLQTVAEDVSAL